MVMLHINIKIFENEELKRYILSFPKHFTIWLIPKAQQIILKHKKIIPWIQGVNLTYITPSRDVWTSYVRPIYVEASPKNVL